MSTPNKVFFFKMCPKRPSDDAPAPDFLCGYSDDIRETTTAVIAANVQVMRPELRIVNNVPRIENGVRVLGTFTYEKQKFAHFIYEAMPPAWFKPSAK